MKAIAAPNYGPLETLAELDAPTPEPGSREVRVRVGASALNPADYKVVTGTLKLLHARNRPLIVGYDFSGVIEAVGASVTDFAVGDDVFGFLPYGPFNKRGAFAETLIAGVDEIARKPKSVSHATAAAAATTALTALQAIRDLGRLPDRGQIAITGVSGGVGSIGIGVARKLGAVDVIDRKAQPIPGDLHERFDVVFDASGLYRWSQWRNALKRGGGFVTTLPSGAFFADKVKSLFASTRASFVNVKSRRADLELLAGWLEEGLEVPLTSTIPVRDVARGLIDLQKNGGRVAVQVEGGF